MFRVLTIHRHFEVFWKQSIQYLHLYQEASLLEDKLFSNVL